MLLWRRNSCRESSVNRSRMEQGKSQRKTTSQDLLSCGNGRDFHDNLLLKSKGVKPGGSFQTTKVPRSSVLDRLQTFLPQMAQANEELREQIESSPAGRFDIECVSESGKVIEMDVALVELENSDSDAEGETSDDDSTSDSEPEWGSEITEETLKLPGNQRKGKPHIEVVEKEDV